MQDERKLQIPIVLSFLDDARRLIEGGKNRRWEVLKWTVAVNVLLSTAALTQPKLPIAQVGLFVLACAVTLMGGVLIAHYDRRMTRARERARNLIGWIRTNASLDMHSIMGEPNPIRPGEKDVLERVSFYIAIVASLLAVAIALSLK